MGTSMASVAFRRTEKVDWKIIKTTIEEMCLGIDGTVSNLDDDGLDGYAIVSPYGDMGMYLTELPEKISRLTGDYAVMTVCVDSDFAMLELYYDGKLVERTSIGEVYMEIDELGGCGKPDIALWAPLLKDQTQTDRLVNALHGNEILVEDQLRAVSALTGIPIFNDTLVYGSEW